MFAPGLRRQRQRHSDAVASGSFSSLGSGNSCVNHDLDDGALGVAALDHHERERQPLAGHQHDLVLGRDQAGLGLWLARGRVRKRVVKPGHDALEVCRTLSLAGKGEVMDASIDDELLDVGA